MKRASLTVLGLACALLFASTLAPAMQAAGTDAQPLLNISDGTRAGGVSRLARHGAAGAISVSLNASHLMPGAAYSHWVVIVNNPSACNGPCDPSDFLDATGAPIPGRVNDLRLSILGGSGAVANNGGNASFESTVFEGTALGQFVLIGPGGFALDVDHLLEDADTAEVFVVVRNHGPAQSGADLAEQLLTFNGNCIGLGDDDPQFNCVDEQLALHLQ